MTGKKGITVRDVCVMALLTAILFLQEELLTFLPNVQLTVFLILLYAKCLGLLRTGLIVTVYLLLDATYMGALNPFLVGCQWVGWMLGPVITCLFLKKQEGSIGLAFAAAGYAFLYSWVLILPSTVLFHVSLKAYMIADIPFELILAASSFLTTLLLYEPLSKLLRKLLRREIAGT